MRIVVAVDGDARGALASGLTRTGYDVIAEVEALDPALAASDGMTGADASRVARALADADVLVLEVSRGSATSTVVAACDRAGVRIVPLCGDVDAERLAAALGLERPHPLDVDAWTLADAISAAPHPVEVAPATARGPRTIAVWGPAGAPGRSTVAIELAVELARGGGRVALVDADTHAPSIALALGLADEGPGFAAACRQAAGGTLDARELSRISMPLGRTGVDVLTGLNRPSRWPELSDARVEAALEVCRDWADHTIVDVSSSLERDEEIVSDLDGPRRNAATIAALRCADLVAAVVGADPVGVSRFLRAYPDVRATVGSTRIAVLANRLRPGTLGIDARGQVRRTLDRFGGVGDVWFLPQDPRSADAALLAAQPIATVAPKSPFTLALRRFAGEAVVPPVAAAERSGSRRGAERSNRRTRTAA